MTRNQILNYGHYMTVGHGCTSIALFMGCQEKSEDHRKYFKIQKNQGESTPQMLGDKPFQDLSFHPSPREYQAAPATVET
jgi:hypothetical protein